jgi:hypothetical protein
VSLWYRSGLQSNEFLSGRTFDPLANEWANTIAILATARLERPPCQCANVQNLFEKLRTDITQNDRSMSFFVTPEIVRNPLGTRYGEVLAWRRLQKPGTPKKSSVAVI